MKKIVAENLKSKLPEKYKISWKFGGIGTAIGAGIGGYIAAIKSNILYAGLGAAIGGIVGDLIGLILGKKVSLRWIASVESKFHSILGLVSYCLAIVCIMYFLSRKESVLIFGAIVFALIGTYLFRKKDGGT